MDKKILNEVYRLQSLMGVKKQLVTEDTFNPKPIAEFMQGFFTNLSKERSGDAKTILGKFMRDNFSRAMDDALYQRLISGELVTILDEVTATKLKKIVTDIMSSSTAYKSVYEPIYRQTISEKIPFIIESEMGVLESRIKNAEQNIQLSADKAATQEAVDEAYLEMIKASEKEYPGIYDELLKAIETRVGRKINKKIVDIDWAMDIWETTYRGMKGSEFDYFIQNIVKFKDTFFRTQSSLLKELQELETEFAEIQQKSGGAVSETKLARATSIIYTLKTNATQSIESFVNSLQGTISADFINQIKKSDRFIDWLEGGKKWIDEKGKVKALGYTLSSTLEELKSTFKAIYGSTIILPFIRRVFTNNKSLSDYFSAVKSDILDGLKRDLNYIVSQTTRLPSEIVILRNTIGVTKMSLLGSLFLGRFTTSIVFPAQITLLTFLFELAKEVVDIFGEDTHSWGQGDFGEKWNVWEWILNELKKNYSNFSSDFSFIFGELKKHGYWFMPFTNMDELWDILANGNNKDIRDAIERRKKSVEEAWEKLKNQMNDLERKTDDELKSLKEEIQKILSDCENLDTDVCKKAKETLDKINEILGERKTPKPEPEPEPGPENYPYQTEFENYLESKQLKANSTTPYDSNSGVYYDQNSKEYEYIDGKFKEL